MAHNSAFTGQPAPQSLESDFLSPTTAGLVMSGLEKSLKASLGILGSIIPFLQGCAGTSFGKYEEDLSLVKFDDISKHPNKVQEQ